MRRPILPVLIFTILAACSDSGSGTASDPDTGGNDTGGNDTGGNDTGGNDTGGGDTGGNDTGGGGSATFFAPAPISDRLELTRSVSWTELSTTPADLTRFSMGAADGSDLIVVTDDGDIVGTDLAVESDMAAESADTYDRLLRSMFQLVVIDSGAYRIMSTKHSNYALDADGSDVILRDIRSSDVVSGTAGFLVFELESDGDDVVLAATSREIHDDGNDFIIDGTWVRQELAISGSALELADTGTPVTLYEPPIDFDIPFDINPDNVARVDNDEVDPGEAERDAHAETANMIVSEYADQVAAAGIDSGTTAAAEAMLDDIETTLSAEGAQMRYPAELYLAFREGMLSRTVRSADSYDGVIGQLTVPYVFFTNEADDDGVHHPFMVIASYGVPDSLGLLWDVPRPPGDGIGGGYAEQDVTRRFTRENFLMKIPMRDYGQVDSLTENIMLGSLADDEGETQYDHHNYASVSATGVAIDGVVIYPSYNNTLNMAQSAGELSTHGMHSGRGLGAHYHADAHSASGEGLNLYNAEDYEGQSHPPLISFGFDGVAGYGVYMSDGSDGASVALDEYGGHEHGDHGYHYHSATETWQTEPAGTSYTAHMLAPRGAWAGRINDVPEFWRDVSPDYVGGRNVWIGTE